MGKMECPHTHTHTHTHRHTPLTTRPDGLRRAGKNTQSTQSTVKEEEEKIQSHPAAAIPLVPGSETLPEDIVSLYH